MTLFVDLQQVPSAILEQVKARILANRKRNRDQVAAAQPPLKTPRRRYYSPQAADRRSEPGAVHPEKFELPYFYIHEPDYTNAQPFASGGSSIVYKVTSGNLRQSATVATSIPAYVTPPPFSWPDFVLEWDQYDVTPRESVSLDDFPYGFAGENLPAAFVDTDEPALSPAFIVQLGAFPYLTGLGFDARRYEEMASGPPFTPIPLANPEAFGYRQYAATYYDATFNGLFFVEGVSINALYYVAERWNPFTRPTTLCLPLGRGRSLVVFSAYRTDRATISKRGGFRELQITANQPEVVTRQEVYDEFIVYHDLKHWQHTGFVCSYESVKEVDLPSALTARIEELYVDEIRLGSVRVPAYGLNSENPEGDPVTDFIFHMDTLGSYTIARMGGREETAENRLSGLRQCTPSDWFSLDGEGFEDKNLVFRDQDGFAINSPWGQIWDGFLTHEGLRSYKLRDGVTTIGSVIRPGYFFALGDDGDMPASDIYAWRNGFPEGKLYIYDIERFMPIFEDVPEDERAQRWKRVKNSLQPTLRPADARRIYISDWGNPQFCGQQAVRWRVNQL